MSVLAARGADEGVLPSGAHITARDLAQVGVAALFMGLVAAVVHQRRIAECELTIADAAGGASRPPRLLHEHFERDPQPLVQRADHADAQPTLARQHLGHARAAAEVLLQVAPREPALVHDEEDGVDRVRELHRPALLLVHLDDQRQKLELVRLRRSGCRRRVQEPVQLGQGRGVFGFVVDEVSHRTS